MRKQQHPTTNNCNNYKNITNFLKKSLNLKNPPEFPVIVLSLVM